MDKRLTQRAQDGQLIWDEEHGAELAERFLTLDETDQEKFWANVQLEADRENWMAGGPGLSPWERDKPARNTPLLRPSVPFPADLLTLEAALNRLGRVRARGKEWLAFCPAHDTRHRSLVISESKFKQGEPVFFCYAGCTHQAVKEAILRMVA